MKLEVGMYVKTRYGIAKVTNLSETIGSRGFYMDREIMDCNEENWKSFCTIHDVIGEPSFNIIDLIEVGDYVNGYEVTSKDQFLGFGNHDWYIADYEIKSIVTKEQFESMKYSLEG